MSEVEVTLQNTKPAEDQSCRPSPQGRPVSYGNPLCRRLERGPARPSASAWGQPPPGTEEGALSDLAAAPRQPSEALVSGRARQALPAGLRDDLGLFSQGSAGGSKLGCLSPARDTCCT